MVAPLCYTYLPSSIRASRATVWSCPTITSASGSPSRNHLQTCSNCLPSSDKRSRSLAKVAIDPRGYDEALLVALLVGSQAIRHAHQVLGMVVLKPVKEHQPRCGWCDA